MDYKTFLDNNIFSESWETENGLFKESEKELDSFVFNVNKGFVSGANGTDSIVFNNYSTPFDSRVDHPSHYTSGKTEAIDVIEDAIKDAPNSVVGLLQGQVLKYILRVWLKDNPKEDLLKARWYLNRLIDKL